MAIIAIPMLLALEFKIFIADIKISNFIHYSYLKY